MRLVAATCTAQPRSHLEELPRPTPPHPHRRAPPHPASRLPRPARLLSSRTEPRYSCQFHAAAGGNLLARVACWECGCSCGLGVARLVTRIHLWPPGGYWLGDWKRFRPQAAVAIALDSPGDSPRWRGRPVPHGALGGCGGGGKKAISVAGQEFIPGGLWN